RAGAGSDSFRTRWESRVSMGLCLHSGGIRSYVRSASRQKERDLDEAEGTGKTCLFLARRGRKVIPVQLAQSVRGRGAILFVGAGVSMNLGLPSFTEVVDAMAKELGYDPELFRILGQHSVLAEYYKLEKKTIGPLRSKLDLEWHNKEVRIEESIVHRLIVELNFPIIYTTNYDRWLERAYERHGKPFTKITHVANMPSVHPDRTQIVKFHGDFDDDESLVLTESSYFERLDLSSPLDIKLRA